MSLTWTDFRSNGSFQKRSAPPPRRKWIPPSLRTSQDSRTSPSPRKAKPKIIPSPLDISYFIRFNKSWQRHSNYRTSWTSVSSTSSQRQALVAVKTCCGAEAALATRQQRSIKGQTNEGQLLKSKQTFCFESERYYFYWIWGFCSLRVLFMCTSSYSLINRTLTSCFWPALLTCVHSNTIIFRIRWKVSVRVLVYFSGQTGRRQTEMSGIL